MPEQPPERHTLEDKHEILRNQIDEAELLARGYKNGLIQHRPIEERRAWANRAAKLLDVLAAALNRLLPEEGHSRMIDRIAARNAREREAQGEAGRLEFPKRERRDKDDRH